jgi:hypothetical protein
MGQSDEPNPMEIVTLELQQPKAYWHIYRERNKIMSETIDPGAEKFSEKKHQGEGGDRLQNEGAPAINKLRNGLRDNFLIILLGSVAISFLVGYFISRQQEAQKREQWAEIVLRHAKDWLSSTAEQASSKGVQYGQRLNPFYREPRRRFLASFDLWKK